jgi:cytochrome c5
MILTRLSTIPGVAIVLVFVVSGVVSFAGSLNGHFVGGEQQPKYPARGGLSFAAETASLRNGAYTASQAQQGKILYEKQCALCHGETLEGAGQIAPLSGDEFMAAWAGRTLADLYTQTQKTMPTSQPGSLKPDETVKLLAYILRANKFPAGKTELPQGLESLKAIHIERPNP